MRITRDLLHKFARETVKQRQRSEPDLYAAYLSGSLLDDEPLLGGTTDIDLILVHKFQAPTKRETVGLTREISLDIFHEVQDRYAQHRQLRQDPWMGYPLFNTQIVLFDTDHWLEFIQSSVRADFLKPENILVRVNYFFNAARDNWLHLAQKSTQNHLEWLDQYLLTLSMAANALSGLEGPPLSTRRFLMDLRYTCELIREPKFFAGFMGLLGATSSNIDRLPAWIDAFEKDYVTLDPSNNPPPHVAACRQAYYVDALRDFASGDVPSDAAWPLLRTWLDVRLASSTPPPSQKSWESLLETLELTAEAAGQKVDALDAFLDTLEIEIEDWAESNGLQNLPDLSVF